jgi:hypothetical protein
MLEVNAKSTYLDLSKSLKGFYIIAIGAFISILTYVAYQNLVVTTTMIVCTVAAYIILSQPPKNIKIKIGEEGLVINTELLNWQNILGWAIVDLGGNLEIVVQTTNFAKDFYYFYLKKQEPEVNKLIESMAQYLPYDERIVQKNKVHVWLRNWGLK